MVEFVDFSSAFGNEKVTIDATAGGIGLTAATYRTVEGLGATPRSAQNAFITLDGTAGTNDIRYTVDGTAPVATSRGHLFKAGSSEPLIVKGFGNIVKFRAIREGGASGVIQVTYF